MKRQLLNIVVRHPKFYALHRIKLAKNLFYEATETATAQEVAKAEKKNEGWPPTFLNLRDLPRAVFFFPSHPATTSAANFHYFSLLQGQGEGCVMFADPDGSVTVYDADTKSPFPMRPAVFPKPYNSITLSRTVKWGRGRDKHSHYSKYVMSTEDSSFELFNYHRTTSLSEFHNDWGWHLMPQVRLFARNYNTYFDAAGASPPFAAAMVDSYTICASSKEGTYTFDMFSSMWYRAARWTLPFHGAAEYVPKFRRWFALEDPKSFQHRLCAFDLPSFEEEEAPAPLDAWDYLDGLPDGWCTSERRLVNLGMGKFCIATHFFRRPSPEEEDDVKKVKVFKDEELTVLTGVEVVRAKGGLQRIKHKSRYYSAENMGIHCIL
ncbi:hypothetical protein ACQ4PT_056374 [Festuca glaucescens]